MKKISILRIAIALGLITCLLTGNQTVMAADANNGQALEIAPPVLILTADPGQTISAKITVRNISGGKLVVTGQINDFVAAGEDGTPKILMDETNTEKNPYSIIDWISPMPKLDLISKQVATLPITITVPDNASPGGHYGVVRFTGVAPELEGTGVSLSASLGSLILVRVSGAIKDELSISDYYATQDNKKGTFFESAPLTIALKLKNTGNIHEQPSGLITVTDMFGRKLATLGVNATSPQGNILPSSTRLFSQKLDSTVIGNKILFGRYKADLKVTYGTDKTVLTDSITFWVIPYRLIGLGVIILVGGFLGLRFAIRRYNDHIIKKSDRRRR